MKKHIPNCLSLLNLFSGCLAILFVGRGEFLIAFIFVCIGIFFDFFDGFFARVFKVQGELGKQIDSLADMVTSGVVPGLVMFKMLLEHSEKIYSDSFMIKFLPFFGFIITMGSCLRLAKFNIDTKQTDFFIGLPTPANALFILSIPLIIEYTELGFVRDLLSNIWFLMGITILSAYILNAKIQLFSLKIKKNNIYNYKLQILFLIKSVLLLITFKFLGIPLVIIFYILFSVFNKRTIKK